MKRISPALVVLFVFLPCLALAGVLPGGKIRVGFASADEGGRILATRDDFIRRMSPFDRAARMKTDRPVTEADFLSFAGSSALPWDEAEKDQIAKALRVVQADIESLPLALPEEIFVVKTSGKEDGGTPYTRGDAIIIPKPWLAANSGEIRKMLTHELFHILSRRNPGLRDRLYETIGFTKVDEIELPAALASRRITNPDAPKNDHVMRLRAGGKEIWAVPVLVANAEKYDVKRGGSLFDYLRFGFLVVELRGDPPKAVPLYDGSSPRIAGIQEVSGFMEQVGRNTRYLIHPDEILAENFALLLMNMGKVPSPDIIRRMREVLQKGPPAGTVAPVDR